MYWRQQLVKTPMTQSTREFLENTKKLYQEWEAQTLAKGKQEEAAQSVLVVLETRNLLVTEAQREAILTCTDLATLEHWHRLAITATSTDEVIESKAPVKQTSRVTKPRRR